VPLDRLQVIWLKRRGLGKKRECVQWTGRVEVDTPESDAHERPVRKIAGASRLPKRDRLVELPLSRESGDLPRERVFPARIEAARFTKPRKPRIKAVGR
jgi:hypothetical protein